MSNDININENKNQMDCKICRPSFKVERRTRAFNRNIWSFVALLSLFTVGAIIPILYVMIIDGILGWKGSFIIDHFLIFPLGMTVINLLLIPQGRAWFNSLLCSYKIEPGQITKGKIKKAKELNRLQIAVNHAVLTGYLIRLTRTKSTGHYLQISGLWKSIKLIMLNMREGFAEHYFDTEVYKKQVYKNPQLIEEKKYTLVYSCDNGKKLEIPKIYDSMFEVPDTKKAPFISRIMKRVLIVFLLAWIPCFGDLAVTGTKQEIYEAKIEKSYTGIEEALVGYGWTPAGDQHTFHKQAGEGKESRLRYYINPEGNVEDVDIQLYYGADAQNVEEELTYIISTLNDDFDSVEVEAYVQAVRENLDGGSNYKKLLSENEIYNLIISKSEGYIDIHNYNSDVSW